MKRRDRVASRRTSTKTGRPRQRGHSKRPISHADDLDPFIHQTCAKHASSTRKANQPTKGVQSSPYAPSCILHHTAMPPCHAKHKRKRKIHALRPTTTSPDPSSRPLQTTRQTLLQTAQWCQTHPEGYVQDSPVLA